MNSHPSRFNKIKRSAEATMVGIMAVLALNACSSDNTVGAAPSTATEAARDTPSAEPTEEPTESTVVTVEEGDTTGDSPEANPAEFRETNIYDSTSLSQQEIAKSEELEQMSLEEYHQQSLKDRLIYVLYKNHETQEDILFSDHTDQVFEDDGTSLAQHSPVFLALNAKSGGSDILKASIYAEQLSTAWKVDEDEYGSGVLDNLTSSKLLSGMILDLESPEYASYVGETTTNTQTGRFTDADVNDFKVVSETDVTPAVNPIDKKTETVEKTLTILRAGTQLEYTYVFIPLVEQLSGEAGVDGNGVWLLKRSSEFDAERLTQ